jgi:hypothetical protein
MERSFGALLGRGSRGRGSRGRGSLGRGALPDGGPARWQPVAQVLAALTSAPESGELTGQARALAEFRASAAAPARGADLPAPAPRRNPGWMTWVPGRRPAVAAATGTLLMGGLLAVAYAGDLPVPAQRLAHNTIHAPAASPDPDPAASSRPAVPPNSAGRAGQRAADVPAVPDRRMHGGFAAGHPHRHGSSGSPSGSSSGRPDSGRPGSGRLSSGGPDSGRQGQSGPMPAPWPSPSASISPPAGATPSPSAAPSPSQSGPPNPQQGPSSPQSTPP